MLDDKPPIKKTKTRQGLQEGNKGSEKSVMKTDVYIIENMLTMEFKATFRSRHTSKFRWPDARRLVSIVFEECSAKFSST